MNPKKKNKMVTSHVILPVEVMAKIERLRRRLEANGPATMSHAIRCAVIEGLKTLEAT